MKKRVLAMLLTAAVLCTLLAACGGGTSSSSAATSGSTSTGSSAATGSSTAADDGVYNADLSQLPLVENLGDYTFSIFCDDSSATGEFYMLDEFEKQTNVKVDLRINAYENAQTRLNLDLNADDYADVIGGWILDESMILKYGVQQKVFIPLEDIYAQYCPKITEILDQPGVREQMTAPDGHIYTIPYVCGDVSVGYSPYINDEWLEKVGKEMPTTTEEFEEVLKAFKTVDFNGDGEMNEIPFSTDPNNKHIEAMAGYFGMPMDKRGFAIYNGEVVYAGVSPEYREFLKWFSNLYAQGLIDPEIFTQDSAMWEGKGNRGLYGCSIAYGSTEFSGEEKTAEKGIYSPLPVLNADNGGIWLRDTPGNSVYRTQAVITDKAERPEVIARWFDNAFELENGIGCSRGPVGIVTFKEGENQYRAIDTTTLDAEMQEKVSWSNLWPQSLPKYMPAGWKYIEDNPLYDEKKALEDYYEPWLTDECIVTPWMDAEVQEEYADIATMVQNYFTTNQAQFVAGELDVNDDKAWQSYVDGLKAMSLERYCEIRGVTTIRE